MRPDAVPFHPEDRHVLIDALRGLALAGVLLVNLGYFSLYELMTSTDRMALPSARFDVVGEALLQWLVNGKAITLFSLLFGLGFAMQFKQAGERGDAGLLLILRRLLWLLVIGLLHSYLLWWGDILATYAVVGLLLVLFRNASDRVLIVGGLLIAIVLPNLLQAWPEMIKSDTSRAQMHAHSLAAFLSSDAAWTLAANATMANWVRFSSGPLICFVLGRFLLGYWAGRRGLLQYPERHRALLRRLLWIAMLCAVLSSLIIAIVDAFAHWPGEAGRILHGSLSRLGPLAMGVAYAVAFALLFLRPRIARWLALLAPVGRMALTHYLMQSLIGVALFYGVGLGWGPGHGVAGVGLAWVGIFSVQLLASHWWLARFRHGPCEWLWRSLAYGARQPMRLPRVALAS